MERPFHYVELSLLNGRTFHSLEHLNEVTRWWLANVADVRVHGTTKKRPIDAHAEERPHLLPLPAQDYDTARVVYRIVDEEGYIRQDGNQYSVPWQLVGTLLPVRITETEVVVYDAAIQVVARTRCCAASPVRSNRTHGIALPAIWPCNWNSCVHASGNWARSACASSKGC